MFGRIKTLVIDVDTTGVAGSATGSGTSYAINGHVIGVQTDYNALAPGTTDMVITCSNPSDTILSLANQKTDRIDYPRNIVSTNGGVAATTGDNLFYPFVIQGTITVAVSDCDALTDAVKVRIYYI